MTKTKYLLYAFKLQDKSKYTYWYETDNKYFRELKPPQDILNTNTEELSLLENTNIIENPWIEWESDDTQKIVTKDGVCINYLKSTDNDFIIKKEDLKLLETYTHLVEEFDISQSFGFDIVKQWHEMVFNTIYPFAGELRTVNMSKGMGDETWEWKIQFLGGLGDFDKALKKVTSKEYTDLESITSDLSEIMCDFLFIHPFREGNGRLSRLIGDMILAKNGLPMIGLKIQKSDNYIQKVHEGYECNYEPMKELLKVKIKEELDSE